MTSEEEIAAGELLERVKHNKSAIVVTALNEYMQHHPELQEECSIHLHYNGPKGKDLEQIVRNLIQEHLGKVSLTQAVIETPKETEDQVSSDIMDMLDDLDMFGI